MEILLPKGWPRPKGYSNAIVADGKTIFVSGQIGWDENEKFTSKTLAGQFEQILINTLAIINEAEAGPEHIVRMTWFITSRNEYLSTLNEIGKIYRRYMGSNYPAMSVVEVTGLMEKDAVIEIETTAVVPYKNAN